MTRQRVSVVALALASCLLLRPTSAASDEALTYATLKHRQPTAGDHTVEIVEVFWYGCPDCGELEPHLNRLMDEMEDDVAFRRMPAVAPRWEPHARAFYAAEAIGELECFHEAIGQAMQRERRTLFTENDLVDFAEEIGLDPEAFRNAYRSQAVDKRVLQAEALTKRFGIDAVPALVINGKYRTSLRLAGDHQTMSDTAERLLRDELSARDGSGTNRRRR